MNGPIAQEEYLLIWRAFLLMLIVVVPVIVLTLGFAWRYRATNEKAAYRPDWDYSVALDLVLWGIPMVMIAVLGTIVWERTHALDPYKPLPGDAPVRVQAVALDWKWLFIYPDLGIATVNELAIPVDRPIAFQITSQVAMNSFMIPELAGQIYAMAGMQTKLHLKAGETGTLQGRNMQYSGDGFSEQYFDVLVMTDADFNAWTDATGSKGTALDAAAFAEMSKPSIAAPVSYYTSVPEGFFHKLVMQHHGGAQDSMTTMGGSEQ